MTPTNPTRSGGDGPFSGFPNMMGNLINTLQRDGYTDRVIHYVVDACRDHESLVSRAALADKLKERVRYADLSVREILSDYGFAAHPQGVEIVAKLNKVSEILSGCADPQEGKEGSDA